MTQTERSRTLLDELAIGLEDGQVVTVSPLLRKAARLAALLQLDVYQALFQMHLDGFELNKGFRHVHFPDDETRSTTCKDAFIRDRTTQDGRVMAHAAEMIEELHKRALEHRERQGAQVAIDNEFMLRSVLHQIRNRLGLFVIHAEMRVKNSASATPSPRISDRRVVFIGHGRSPIWKELRDFLRDRLSLDPVEFEREAVAGLTVTERLEAMLEESCFAFLVLTAEDSHQDGSLHARENVIHEVGLCQGRLGRRRAIVLLEDICQEFTNINGLVQIRFAPGALLSKSEQIRQILERERIILPATTAG